MCSLTAVRKDTYIDKSYEWNEWRLRQDAGRSNRVGSIWFMTMLWKDKILHHLVSCCGFNLVRDFVHPQYVCFEATLFEVGLKKNQEDNQHCWSSVLLIVFAIFVWGVSFLLVPSFWVKGNQRKASILSLEGSSSLRKKKTCFGFVSRLIRVGALVWPHHGVKLIQEFPKEPFGSFKTAEQGSPLKNTPELFTVVGMFLVF